MEPPIGEAQMVEWDRPKLKRLQKEIAKRVLQGEDRMSVFEFEGHDFVLAYAAYLAEYLDGKLGR